jgi:hypothetical protein
MAVSKEMIFVIISIILLKCSPTEAHSNSTPSPLSCKFDADVFLVQDFDTFDQSQDGWRKISAVKGCEEAAANLISQYRYTHGLTVNKMALGDENREYTNASTLYFHEAQIRAEIGHISVAKDYFRLSMHESFGDWNLYVKATLAFIEKDRGQLKRLRNQLATLPVPKDFTYIDEDGKRKSGRPDWWPANLKILDSFLRCFDRSYAEAYHNEKCYSSE